MTAVLKLSPQGKAGQDAELKRVSRQETSQQYRRIIVTGGKHWSTVMLYHTKPK